MSQDKFFENSFKEYCAGPTCETLDADGCLKCDCRLRSKLEEKWSSTIAKLTKLDAKDYSVYTGTSGVALLKIKKNPNDRKMLQDAVKLLNLSKLKKRRYSFLCGDTGPLAIGAVVEYKLGNKASSQNCIDGIKKMGNEVFNVNSDLPNEYLYGRAGFLYSVLYINNNIEPPPFDPYFIRRIIQTIFACGKTGAKAGRFKSPLMFQWHGSHYLGAAHGLSGILYILLQANQYLNDDELTTIVKPTIDYLERQRFSSGNFPSSIGRDHDKYVQWCHGAPGFVYLYSAAYKVFGDLKYLQLALDCGEIVWNRGLLRKGYSLCHGVSGNAYCFLELYQTTKDEKHLHRALKFAEYCLDYDERREEHPPDRPFSLFEGIAGPMFLLLDIQKPMDAKFPGFTL